MRDLFLFLTAMSLHVNATTDNHLNHQMALSQMGDQKGKPLKGIRSEGKELLSAARNELNGISQEDYNFLKGTSALAASGAEWAHLDGITGQGTTILLLEDSGINHADIRKNVEASSPEHALNGMKYKLDHGSGMASLIHAIAPGSVIRVRPIGKLSTSLNSDVRIINASFGSIEENGFRDTFTGVTTTGSNPLIVKSAGNHQQNLSEHPYTKNSESLIPSTLFAGNLRQDYKGSTSSGFPGTNIEFQNSFLWVIADDVLTASGPDNSTQYSPGSGTSNAAAILSGAAALILSKYPGLTTTELKEILLESADRDIFQLFGSGYKTLHISDNSVDFYRKHTQYKKTHKNTSIIDFAEDLSNSNDIILAAEIVGGARGISNRAPTEKELEQFKRILRKIKESGNEELESLSPTTATSAAEKKHRERIQQLLAEIPNGTSRTNTAAKKELKYDTAFWGKGILNIKNALLYAKLKIQNPRMPAQLLREHMLESINNEEQKAAVGIQRIVRGRLINRPVKPTEDELAKRPSITINTSLPGRNFEQMPTDPNEPVVPEQSDEERLKALGVTLPEAPGGKQLKVISDGASASAASSGPVREISPIADSDIPVGASQELREFLKADKKNLTKTFNIFSEKTFKPLMDLEPAEIARRLRELNLNTPFTVNRVIYKDGSSSAYSCNHYAQKITIITLFNDYIRLKFGTRELEKDNKKITNIAMHLLTSSGSELDKQEILSLLKQYSVLGDRDVQNFIINNYFLNVPFVNLEIETENYEKHVAFKPYTGLDIVQSGMLKSIIDNNQSTQTKTALKRFFKTPTGTSILAMIAIKEPIENAIRGQEINYDSFDWSSKKNTQESVTKEGQRILPAIFKDASRYLPELFSILRDYADIGDIPALISAMSHGYNQVAIEASAPALTVLVNQYLEDLLPRVFE